MADIRATRPASRDSRESTENASPGFIYAFRYGHHDMLKIGNSYDPHRNPDTVKIMPFRLLTPGGLGTHAPCLFPISIAILPMMSLGPVGD